MGVRILYDADNGTAVFYCSTTDWAFGPLVHPEVFNEKSWRYDAPSIARAFLRWLVVDPRSLEDSKLESRWYDFVQNGIGECRYCNEVVANGEIFCSNKCERAYEEYYAEEQALRAEEAARV